MGDKTPLDLLREVDAQVGDLKVEDRAAKDRVFRRAELALKKAFGEDSQYLDDLEDAWYPALLDWAQGGEAQAQKLSNILKTAIEDLETGKARRQSAATTEAHSRGARTKVFIVHGHDHSLRDEVARFLKGLRLRPIILEEEASRGRTIIEKFEDHADVGYAVVLLTPDDQLKAPPEMTKEGPRAPETYREARRMLRTPDKIVWRARQNVVFELGFFAAKLGRGNVAVLLRAKPGFEMPSDYSGVVYIAVDDAGTWKGRLSKEIKASLKSRVRAANLEGGRPTAAPEGTPPEGNPKDRLAELEAEYARTGPAHESAYLRDEKSVSRLGYRMQMVRNELWDDGVISSPQLRLNTLRRLGELVKDPKLRAKNTSDALDALSTTLDIIKEHPAEVTRGLDDDGMMVIHAALDSLIADPPDDGVDREAAAAAAAIGYHLNPKSLIGSRFEALAGKVPHAPDTPR